MIHGTLTDTFTGQPIQGFGYSICGGLLQASADSTFTGSVPMDRDCSVKFSGSGLQVPREVLLGSVSDPIQASVTAIAAGSGFPVSLYRTLTGIANAPPGTLATRTGRFDAPLITVYSVGEQLQAQVSQAVQVIAVFTGGLLNAQYGGVVPDIPAEPPEGSVYVRPTTNLNPGVGGLCCMGEGAKFPVRHWLWIDVLPVVNTYVIQHELGHAIGFTGHNPGVGLMNANATVLAPTADEIRCGRLLYTRRPSHWLDTTNDQDSIR